MLTINVVTLFPEALGPMLESSIVGRAVAAGLLRFRLIQLRDFAHDRHQTVDDYAFGGGAGMVLKPEPFFEAVESIPERKGPIVLLSARGRRLDHRLAVRYSLEPELTLLCGHYKDVDQRVQVFNGVRRCRTLIQAARWPLDRSGIDSTHLGRDGGRSFSRNRILAPLVLSDRG